MSVRVWGGSECGVWRTIVATQSKAALQRFMGISRSAVADYWQETGNDTEKALALGRVGVAWHQGIGAWWWPKGEGWHEGKGAECRLCRAWRLRAAVGEGDR